MLSVGAGRESGREKEETGIEWDHCLTSYMELIWPLLFGGPRDYLKRQDRPELPLFLRVDNFAEMATANVA